MGGPTTMYPLAFSDPFNTVNAYSLIGGSAPFVSANVMTLPSGSSVYFGSPAWGAIAFWQIRLQWFTSGQYSFYLHRPDANNYLQCFVSGTSLTLNQVFGGTVHQIATATIALSNSTWYWLQITQFPSVPGDVAYVQAVLFNDTGPGSIGSQIASIAGPTFDAVTALVGRPAMFATGAGVNLGGAFTEMWPESPWLEPGDEWPVS